jgi:hypothetical protein
VLTVEGFGRRWPGVGDRRGSAVSVQEQRRKKMSEEGGGCTVGRLSEFGVVEER